MGTETMAWSRGTQGGVWWFRSPECSVLHITTVMGTRLWLGRDLAAIA